MWRSGQITLQRLQSSIGNLRKQAADVWCRERAVITGNSRHVDPAQSVSFYQPHIILCRWSGRVSRGGRRWSPACRRLIRPDVLPLSVSVHAAAEPSRLVTYDNATIGAAALRCASCIKSSSWPPSHPPHSFSVPPHDPPFCALSLISPVAVSRRQFCSAVAAAVVVMSNKVSS